MTPLVPTRTGARNSSVQCWSAHSVFGLVALILGLTTNQGVIQNAVFIVSYLLLMAVTFLSSLIGYGSAISY